MPNKLKLIAFAPLSLALLGAASPDNPPPVTPDMVQAGSDLAGAYKANEALFDYEKREAMVKMRDGVELHTVILIPRGARNLPILLERTPYDADGFLVNKGALKLRDVLRPMNREWVDDGYILAFQDIRGKYGSKGDYVMTRPPIGPLNPSKTDDTTDAWDTIDWLVKNLPESNGRVGMIGSSYDGWTVTMALLDPHPALKVAAPESPMIDGWMGDDWFHYGAFRQSGNFDYFLGQTSQAGKGASLPRRNDDDYANFLEGGSAGAIATANGLDKYPFWKRVAAHPAYDAFWQYQALDKLVADHPSQVPTMWLQGLWDQEDMYGAVHTWEALKAKGFAANNHLVMGPWFHSQINRAAWELGPLKWKGDTAADFRSDVMIPFFNSYLKDRPSEPLPQAMIYNPAENHWDKFADWPGTAKLKPLYLEAGMGLGFAPPAAGEDSYVSDPAKPVPYLAPPINASDHGRWPTWLVQDQRFAAVRPDVLVYQTPVLASPVRLEGAPVADIFAKTTGSDGDFVVKLIDVYPPTHAEQPEMASYQLAISLDIFRGRYRQSLSAPSPIPAGQTQEYKFRLPTVNYTFQPGHRIMVQIQSSLFPLYDRNPQSYVPNIFYAKPEDYRKATVSVVRGQSSVLLPVVAKSTAEK